jgi:two-component system LytT family response regulator
VEPLRILVVDDEPAARNGIRQLLRHDPDVRVVGEARNGREAVQALEKDGVDLVFLDVQMPELDGFGVVSTIGARNMPAVVFVTAYDRHALRAFEVHALDYLLKPFTDERFHEALEHARVQIRQGRLGELSRKLAALLSESDSLGPPPATAALKRLAIRGDGRVTLLPVRDIDWIEAEKDYLRVHVGKNVHVIRETMKNLEGQLDPARFVRIHRSTIVNLERIKELHAMFKGEYVVVLHDGTELKLSRGFRHHFEARLGRPI